MPGFLDDEFLRLEEAAALAKLSTRTLRRALAVSTRPLRHYRIGRRVVIARRDLTAWIESHRAAPIVSPAAVAAAGPGVREILARLNRTPGAPEEAKL